MLVVFTGQPGRVIVVPIPACRTTSYLDSRVMSCHVMSSSPSFSSFLVILVFVFFCAFCFGVRRR